MMNLMALASSVIPLQDISYLKNTGRSLNDVGLEIPGYATATTLRGSVQAVSRSVYEQNGLDMSKKYVSLFLEKNFIDLDRGVSGDRFIYNGETYQVESETDWFNYDGWTYLMAVRID